MDDDFCEMMEHTLDDDVEKKSVKTATLLEHWAVHKSKVQIMVITLGII